MSNGPLGDWKDYIQANLPTGMTYANFRFVVNGKNFLTYQQANWYLGYLMRSGGFDPLSLFAGGTEGAWFDPSDLSTLFQDSAGTTPVTASGQPVGKMLDKSGNGNHATQAVSASRPIYTEGSGLAWLAFDGVDDLMAVADVSGMRQSIMTFFIGVDPLSLSLSTREEWFASGNSGAFSTNNYILGNDASSFQIFGRTPAALVSQGSMTANAKVIVSARSDGTNINSRINGAAQTTAALTLGTNDTTGFTLGSSKNNGVYSRFTQMNMYGLIVRGSTSSADEITSTEAYLAAKTGVTL